MLSISIPSTPDSCFSHPPVCTTASSPPSSSATSSPCGAQVPSAKHPHMSQTTPPLNTVPLSSCSSPDLRTWPSDYCSSMSGSARSGRLIRKTLPGRLWRCTPNISISFVNGFPARFARSLARMRIWIRCSDSCESPAVLLMSFGNWKLAILMPLLLDGDLQTSNHPGVLAGVRQPWTHPTTKKLFL